MIDMRKPVNSKAQMQPTGREHRVAVVYRPIAELRLDPKNPRLHSDKQVRQIARSIEAFGFNVPA